MLLTPSLLNWAPLMSAKIFVWYIRQSKIMYVSFVRGKGFGGGGGGGGVLAFTGSNSLLA